MPKKVFHALNEERELDGESPSSPIPGTPPPAPCGSWTPRWRPRRRLDIQVFNIQLGGGEDLSAPTLETLDYLAITAASK